MLLLLVMARGSGVLSVCVFLFGRGFFTSIFELEIPVYGFAETNMKYLAKFFIIFGIPLAVFDKF